MRLLLLTLCIAVVPLKAQVVHIETIQDTCDMFRLHKLDQFPPLYDGMDWQAAIALLVVDTIAKSASIQVVDSALTSLSHDSLLVALRNLHVIRSYDPLLFQVLFRQKLSFYPSGYKSSYRDIASAMLSERVRRYGEYDAVQRLMLMISGGIYRVKIRSISSRMEHNVNYFGIADDSAIAKNWCADAIVLDRIVGEKIRENVAGPEGAEYGRLVLKWRTDDRGTRTYEAGTNESDYQNEDYLEEGKEYIVILNLMFEQRDPPWTASYYVQHRMPIINEVVENPSEYFGIDSGETYENVKMYIETMNADIDSSGGVK
jgi:hypothetical protein